MYYMNDITVIKVGTKDIATNFFFSMIPVRLENVTYRRKDKVLTTCVDTMPADIPHDTYGIRL